MNLVSTGRPDISYSDEAPILIAATSATALARAERTIDAAGRRVGARLALAEAAGRIADQAAASAVWLEIDEDAGGPLDDLLGQIRADVAAGRFGAVVATSAALLDPVFGVLGDSDAALLIDASEAERVAALALASAAHGAARLSDVASDSSSARLRQLSDEVNRIAATLARLSAAPGAAPAAGPVVADNAAAEPPSVAPETVRAVIRARRLRTRFFADDLFADPAWDMLLDLLAAELSHLRVPVSSLCIAAAVPATTALRWLKTMVDQGLFVRRADPHDGRRVFVELSPGASSALRRYFAEVEPAAVI